MQACTDDGSAYTKCDCSGGATGVAGGGWGGSSYGGEGGGAGEGGFGAGTSGGAGGDAGGGGAPSGGGGPGGGGGASGGSGGSPGGGGWGGGGGWAGGSFGPVGDYAGGIGISEIAIYQGVKISLAKNGKEITNRNAPVVEGRPALVRVFVAPESGFQSRSLTALLELASSNPAVKPQTVSLTVNGASSDGSLGSSFNFTIPPDQMTSDLGMKVSIHEPSGATVGSVSSSVAFPSQGALAVGAKSSGTVHLTIVPFKYMADGSGRMPDTSDAHMKALHDIVFAMYPTAKVDLSLREPVNYNNYVSGGSGWSTWLDTLCDVRMKDNVDSKVFYYGMMAPEASWSNYGSGIAGLGYVPDANDDSGRCAVGLGFVDADPNGFIMAHEVGHTHGRPHAPCGVSGESFPYSGAVIGAWGYNLLSGKLKEPNGYRDVMSYCDPQWISDVNYSKLFNRIQWVNANYYVVPGPKQLFRKLLVDVDGSLSWGKKVLLEHAPAGRKTSVELVTKDGRSQMISADLVPFSEEPAGALYLPELPNDVVAVQADGLPAIAAPEE